MSQPSTGLGHIKFGFNIRSACDALGCGRTKIYQLIGDGRLDAKKLDGITIVTAESMARLVESLPKADIRTGQRAKETAPAA